MSPVPPGQNLPRGSMRFSFLSHSGTKASILQVDCFVEFLSNCVAKDIQLFNPQEHFLLYYVYQLPIYLRKGCERANNVTSNKMI